MLNALLRAITTSQRGKSHCCQQARLPIWWGVNIFSVTVCKHHFFSSKSSLCTHSHAFLWGHCSVAVNILCLPFSMSPKNVLIRGPSWASSQLIPKSPACPPGELLIGVFPFCASVRDFSLVTAHCIMQARGTERPLLRRSSYFIGINVEQQHDHWDTKVEQRQGAWSQIVFLPYLLTKSEEA